MLELRQKAWRFFEEIPWPTGKEETWRRTRLTGFNLEDFALAPEPDGDVPAAVKASLAEVQSVSRAGPGQRAPHRLQMPAELAARGVIFTDLHTAVREHPELRAALLRHRGRRRTRTSSQRCTTRCGTAGLSCTCRATCRSRRRCRRSSTRTRANCAGIHHTLVVAEEGASVTLVEDFLGADEGMVNSVVELLPGPSSQVHYLHLQNLADTAWNFSTQRMLLVRDSLLRYLIGSWGSRLSKNWINMEMNGPGSHGELLGLYFPNGRQHIDHHTNQLHRSPNATSDLLFKGALKDRARSVYQGYVKVWPDAQKTNAYQANRNLLLSKHARADSIPGLEIEANDVRCTHGATASQLQEEYVFYLMSRGIARPNAERLVVQGFLEEVLDRIPVEGVRAKLEMEIARKLGL